MMKSLAGSRLAYSRLTQPRQGRSAGYFSRGFTLIEVMVVVVILAILATIVVPNNAPRPKKFAIEAYGATIVYCEPNVAAREAAVEKLIAEQDLELVHPFNDYRVMNGQGTAALELLGGGVRGGCGAGCC